MERRKFLRVKKQFPFNFNLRGESAVWDAETFDISLGGIGFFHSQPIALNQIIHIRMKIPGYAGEMAIRGIVRWTKKTEKGEYFVGVEFFNIEEEEKDLILKALREG